MTIKDTTYFQVQAWMVTKLGLKTVERDVFAIIYGYSQDEESDYHGSLAYMAELTGYSRNSICTALKSLTEKQYIIKTEKIVDNIKSCRYVVNMTTVQAACTPVQRACTPVQAVCTNNISNNNKNKNDILSKDNISSERASAEFNFGNVSETKKPNLYQKCINLIDDFTNIPSIRNPLIQYLDLCMEMKSIRGANQWKGMLNTLEKVQLKCHPHTYEEIIQRSIDHGWKTFYPIDDAYIPKTKSVKNDIERIGENDYDKYDRTISEMEF